MSATKYLCLALTNLFLLASQTYAIEDTDIDLSNYSAEDIHPPEQQSSPFSVTTRIDAIKKADITEGFYKGDSIDFREADIEGAMIFYYDKDHAEGANIALSYTATCIHWQNNPWFEQERFNTVTLSLGGASKRFHHWYWRGQIDFNIDADEWNWSNYAFYNLLLWGRYEYASDIGIHIGIIVQTGMKMDRVYPILGFDWQINPKWKLNFVFPVNVSLQYLINRNWSVSLAGRSFDFRHRVGPHECNAKSLIRYQNVGAELAVLYEDSFLSANLHAGYALGGRLRIANSDNTHPHHYRFGSSPYAGAEVVLKF